MRRRKPSRSAPSPTTSPVPRWPTACCWHLSPTRSKPSHGPNGLTASRASGAAGFAHDVGVGADGSIWVVGVNAMAGGFGLFHWSGSVWVEAPGAAVRIGVDPSGDPWVVNSLHGIYHWNGSGWVPYPGGAHDVGVGADGIGLGGRCQPDGGRLRAFSVERERVGGAPRCCRPDVGVDPSGNPWMVDSSLHIFSN